MFRPVLLLCEDNERAASIVRILDLDVRDIDSLTIVARNVREGLEVLAERRLSVAVVADVSQAATIQQLHQAVPGLAIVSIVADLSEVGRALDAGAHQYVLGETLSSDSVERAMAQSLAICAVDHHAPDEGTVDTLMALLAHHMREPVRSARLYNDRAAVGTKQRQWHDRIEEVLGHADLLMTSLLSYLRVDAHEVGPTRSIDLGLVEEELRDHYGSLGATSRTITWALDGVVQCQPESLSEMLRIVVDNALLYTANTSPRVDVASTLVEDHVLIRVTDSGPGISSINRERAFRPLERLTDEGPGVGIGLAKARRLAGLADGDLFIQPGTSGGTTLVLRLRAA